VNKGVLPMKIAMLADRLVMGGLETHIVTVVNELLRRGHHVLLNTAYTNPELLAAINQSAGFFQHRKWSANPRADLSGFKPDLVHSHPFTAIFRGYEAAKVLGKPFFVTMHGLYDFGLDRSPLGNLVAGTVKAVIAVDHRVESVLQSSMAHPEKITVIYNGIDTSRFQPGQASETDYSDYGLCGQWPTIMVISRMDDGKERPIEQLLDCALDLAEALQGVNLIIVGDGGRFFRLQTKVASGLASEQLRLKLTGCRHDVTKIIPLADLVLACDRAALEAMACQKAVLPMNAEGFADVITGDNFQPILLNRSGYRPLTNAELVATLGQLLRDTAGRERCAIDGATIVHRYFRIEQTVDQLEALYRETVVKR
jgi:glycosyltransferase involved in cell wall biosynthesis